jgi:hypothetical protein
MLGILLDYLLNHQSPWHLGCSYTGSGSVSVDRWQCRNDKLSSISGPLPLVFACCFSLGLSAAALNADQRLLFLCGLLQHQFSMGKIAAICAYSGMTTPWKKPVATLTQHGIACQIDPRHATRYAAGDLNDNCTLPTWCGTQRVQWSAGSYVAALVLCPFHRQR